MEKQRKTPLILWAIPLLLFVVETISVLSQKEYDKHIKDPGHRTARFIDGGFLLIAYALVAYVMAGSLIFYAAATPSVYINATLLLLFPYLKNLTLALVFYVFPVALRVYKVKRPQIVRGINELLGVW